MASYNPKRFHADISNDSYSDNEPQSKLFIRQSSCEHQNKGNRVCGKGNNAGREYIYCIDCTKWLGWCQESSTNKQETQIDESVMEVTNKQLSTLNENLLKLSNLFEKYFYHILEQKKENKI